MAHLVMRDTPKLTINERRELIKSCAITSARVEQELCNRMVGCGFHAGHPPYPELR